MATTRADALAAVSPGGVCRNLSRFLELDPVFALPVSAGEVSANPTLNQQGGGLALRYVCWRRSTLAVAMLPYAINVGLKVYEVGC